MRMEHDRVWEEHNGPTPEGMQVHHVDEVKLNNSIENLELLDALTHKRIHSGCVLRDGEWWKPCRKCGVTKHIGDFYFNNHHHSVSSNCKPCDIRAAVEIKRNRRRK